MKKIVFALCLYNIFFSQVFFAQQQTVDTIIAIVSSSAGTEIITQSDLDRPTIFGKFRTLDECELEKALLLDAKQHQIYVDDDMVESYFESIQKAYNITREQVQQMFLDGGYTIQEGKEQLRDSQITNIILQKEVYEKMSVSVQEIERYFNQFPEFIPATFTLKRAALEDENDQININQISLDQFEFCPLITLQKTEISPEHAFILDLEPGDIHIEKKGPVIEAVHLISKTPEQLIPLEDRTDEIMQILREKKFQTLFEKYREKVLKSVTIIRM